MTQNNATKLTPTEFKEKLSLWLTNVPKYLEITNTETKEVLILPLTSVRYTIELPEIFELETYFIDELGEPGKWYYVTHDDRHLHPLSNDDVVKLIMEEINEQGYGDVSVTLEVYHSVSPQTVVCKQDNLKDCHAINLENPKSDSYSVSPQDNFSGCYYDAITKVYKEKQLIYQNTSTDFSIKSKEINSKWQTKISPSLDKPFSDVNLLDTPQEYYYRFNIEGDNDKPELLSSSWSFNLNVDEDNVKFGSIMNSVMLNNFHKGILPNYQPALAIPSYLSQFQEMMGLKSSKDESSDSDSDSEKEKLQEKIYIALVKDVCYTVTDVIGFHSNLNTLKQILNKHQINLDQPVFPMEIESKHVEEDYTEPKALDNSSNYDDEYDIPKLISFWTDDDYNLEEQYKIRQRIDCLSDLKNIPIDGSYLELYIFSTTKEDYDAMEIALKVQKLGKFNVKSL